jgi:Copper binding proteins, plastocyanin/azurin family
MMRKFLILSVVAIAVFASGACSDDDTIVGPQPTLTPTPPGAPTVTPTPPGPNPTPTPPGPAPTPTPPVGATRIVDMGDSMTFVDRVSGTSTSTIAVGDTIQWVWGGSLAHSTTSGTCSGTCTPDGTWDSGPATGITFSHTFTQAGTFPYFCIPHGAMMTGTVVVQ